VGASTCPDDLSASIDSSSVAARPVRRPDALRDRAAATLTTATIFVTRRAGPLHRRRSRPVRGILDPRGQGYDAFRNRKRWRRPSSCRRRPPPAPVMPPRRRSPVGGGGGDDRLPTGSWSARRRVISNVVVSGLAVTTTAATAARATRTAVAAAAVAAGTGVVRGRHGKVPGRYHYRTAAPSRGRGPGRRPDGVVEMAVPRDGAVGDR
jgi:hypothetical protein